MKNLAVPRIRLLKYLPLLGIVLFIVILQRVDYPKIIKQFAQLDYLKLIWPALTFAISFLMKTLRWGILLRIFNYRIPISQLTFSYLISQFYGSVTPGRIGELYRMKLLAQNSNGKKDNFIAAIFDRLLDVVFVIITGCTLVLLYKSVFLDSLIVITSIIISVVLLAIAIVILKGKYLSDKLTIVRTKYLNKKLLTLIFNFISQFVEAIQVVLKSSWLTIVLLLTLASWSLYFAMAWQIIIILNINVSQGVLLLALFTSILISLLPISYQGMGTRELMFVTVFSEWGLNSELAISSSILIFLVSYIVTLSIGLISLICEPLFFSKMNKNES